MNVLHMVDGSTVNVPDSRFIKFMTMLTHRGIKSVRFDDTLVIVSPSNIVRIELEVEDDQETITEPEVQREERVEEPVSGEDDGENVEEAPEPVPEKEETQQQRNDRIIAEMKAKSDCQEGGHVGQEQIIYFQDVMIKRKGAKTPLPSRRYFPVCSFCGLRQKYIKADSLTDEQKENAKKWQES